MNVNIRDSVVVGNDLPFVLFGGLNVLEDLDLTLKVVHEYKEVTSKLNIPFVFKGRCE